MNSCAVLAAAVTSIALCGALMTASGCQGGGDHASSMVEQGIQALTGQWDLSSLAGVDLSKFLEQGSSPPYLQVRDDGKVGGFAGVNRLSSSLDLGKLSHGQFSLAPAAVTKMAGPPKAMELEDKFLAALNKVTGYKVTGDRLTLTDKAGELMAFARH